jgi:hypothetical protein
VKMLGKRHRQMAPSYHYLASCRARMQALPFIRKISSLIDALSGVVAFKGSWTKRKVCLQDIGCIRIHVLVVHESSMLCQGVGRLSVVKCNDERFTSRHFLWRCRRCRWSNPCFSRSDRLCPKSYYSIHCERC